MGRSGSWGHDHGPVCSCCYSPRYRPSKTSRLPRSHPDAHVRRDKQEVLFNKPDSDFDLPLRCKPAQGKLLTLTDDEKWAACCPPGSRLLGTINTAFDCCGEGHDLAGSKDTGWTCCPSGYEDDGTKCKDPKPLCPNGMELVDGKCVCPPGTTQAADRTCKPNTANGGDGNGGNQAGKHPLGPCSSEISSGTTTTSPFLYGHT